MHKRSPIKPLPVIVSSSLTIDILICTSFLQALERRIPRSAKYAHIESKLDTGLTINKVKVVTAKEYRMRRDEIFFRISCDQLYDLYNEYEADERETIGETLYNSSRGGPKIVTYSEESKPEYIKPYLILDVREVHDYNSCHLLHAKSYPYTLIRRDYLLPEIYTFKNKEETLIILYCDDERISRDTAKTLVDRGIDNVFLLEGGLKEFCGLYPAFVEGNIPFPVQINRKSSTSSTPSSSLTRSSTFYTK